MFDSTLRRRLDRPLTSMAKALDRPWITPNRLTMLGLAAGVASAVSAGFQLWLIAVILWLGSRLADGLDGALARVRRKQGRLPESGAGGFLDITADFVVYGATVFGVGIGTGVEFGSPWWPFFGVLLAYYVNGGAFLAFSSIAERPAEPSMMGGRFRSSAGSRKQPRPSSSTPYGCSYRRLLG